MGLGLIALGFLFLEGIQVSIFFIPLQPHYVALSFILMGLLSIKRRTSVKYLDKALVIGTILFVDYFLIPDITLNQLTYLLSQFTTIVLKYIFYLFLFLMIHQLIHHDKLKKYMKRYLICESVLFLDISYSIIFNVTLPQSFVLIENILVIIHTILVALIAYQMYKQNTQLEDQYVIETITPIKNTSKLLLIVLIIISSVTILISGDFIHEVIEDEMKVELYRWHGEIEDEIYVDFISYADENTMAFSSTSGGVVTDFNGTVAQATDIVPYIWINDEDYQKSSHISYSLYLADEELRTCAFMRIEKDPMEYFSYYDMKYIMNTKMNHYTCINPITSYAEYASDMYRYKDLITIKVTLYDESTNVVETYDLDMSQRKDYQTTSYQDDNIIIKNLEIDDKFLISTPYYKIVSKSDYIDFVISENKELSKDELRKLPFIDGYIYLKDQFVERNDDGTYTVSGNGEAIYYCLPKQTDYYLHIIGSIPDDPNENTDSTKYTKDDRYVMKTLRVER